eukprot:s91_g32.t1
MSPLELQEQWPCSLQLLSSTRQHSLAASVVAGNAAMVAMAWRRAMTLLEVLGTGADQISFNSAISACEKAVVSAKRRRKGLRRCCGGPSTLAKSCHDACD